MQAYHTWLGDNYGTSLAHFNRLISGLWNFIGDFNALLGAHESMRYSLLMKIPLMNLENELTIMNSFTFILTIAFILGIMVEKIEIMQKKT